MGIEICSVGGYNEIGKNMTAVRVNGEVVILDMGLHVENYVSYKGDEDVRRLTAAELTEVDAIPDDSCIKEWRSEVKAIVPTHAHLDHVGAIPFLANKYGAPIICTPYTTAVIRAIVQDDKFALKNKIQPLNAGSRIRLTKTIELEFINVTHSTPQTVIAALHTPQGTVLYANDFKFDNFPTMGKKPDYKRLEELGRAGVIALIVDGTRATNDGKTPSESVAREMLRDVMTAADSKGKMVIVTTFSSHLARIKSIIEFGHKMNRKVVILGRSLFKYISAGEQIGLVTFSKEAELVKYSRQVRRRLKQISDEPRDKYVLLVTGHQGEPDSILSRMVQGDLPFKLYPEEHVIFSCSVIPNPTNRANREILEGQLRRDKVRIYKDVHTSGHASREDLRDLINMVKPKHILPAHGDFTKISALTDLAIEMGYELGHSVHIMRNGQHITF